MLYGFALAYGFGYGVHGAVEASATADIFQGPHLGTILGAIHNLRFYHSLMKAVREAIRERRFGEFRSAFYEDYRQTGPDPQ